MEMISQNFSSDHKLINFNAPKYLIKSFDNLVKFKRVSRTSMLIHLMEDYIRNEKVRMEADGTLNVMITDIETRNRKSIKEEMIGLQQEVDYQLEPPLPPSLYSDVDYRNDDWNDISGIGRLWELKHHGD